MILLNRVFALCIVAIAAAGGTPNIAGPFLRAQETALVLNDKPFRNVGANIPDLFERFLHGEDAAAERTLADAQKVGIRFARCFGSTWGPGDFHLFEEDRARWLGAFDRMLAAAHRHEIALVPSLLFNPRMIPEYVSKKTGRDQGIVNMLFGGGPSNRLAREYVSAIVSRYKDDPRVLFWEIGNEYNLEADLSMEWKRRPANRIPTSDMIRSFLAGTAALIKRIDPNHLVTSGNADMRPYAWHIRQSMLLAQRRHSTTEARLSWPMDWRKDTYEQYVEMLRLFNPPPLDLICVHQYPTAHDTAGWLTEDDTRAEMLDWTRRAADSIGKPLFVGEFAQKTVAGGQEQDAPWCIDFLRRMREGAAPIAAVWAWEFAADEASQSPYALSPTRTPKLCRAIADTNRALRTERISLGHEVK